MLVLSRNCGDTVTLRMPDGREIVVTVTEVRPTGGPGGMGRIKLGFAAPEDVAIIRDDAGRRIPTERAG